MDPNLSAQVSRSFSCYGRRCLPTILPEYPGALLSQMYMSQATYLSAQRLAVDADHVWQGFIFSSNPDEFFDDVSKNTFKNAIYTVETLVGDAILVSSFSVCKVKAEARLYQIYRCYVVWRQIQVIIVSIVGWIALAGACTLLDGMHHLSLELATSVYLDWLISLLPPANADSVFLLKTGQWVVTFYTVALITNLFATGPFFPTLAIRDGVR